MKKKDAAVCENHYVKTLMNIVIVVFIRNGEFPEILPIGRNLN